MSLVTMGLVLVRTILMMKNIEVLYRKFIPETYTR